MSHDLLTADARTLFRRLAVMADRFTLADAHAVAGAGSEMETMAALEQLVDQGLVRMFPETSWSEGSRFFALLHIVREFALEVLESSGEKKATARAHAVRYSAVAHDLERKLLLDDTGVWVEQAASIQADLRAAFWHWLGSDDRAAAWRLIADQRGYWAHAGKLSEAFKWMDAAGVHPARETPDLSDMDMGRTCTAAGLAVALSGDYAPGSALLEKAVTFLEGLGDGPELSRALNYLGLTQLSQGKPEAKATLMRAVEVASNAGVDLDACMSLSFLCEACIVAGDIAGAEAVLERARPIAERHRAGSGEAMYLQEVGNLRMSQGRPEEALAHFEASARLYDAAHMIPLSGWSWWGIGYACFQLRRKERCIAGFTTCLDRARRTSDSAMACAAVLSFALLANDRGDHQLAAKLLGSAEAIAASIGYAFWSVDSLMHKDLKSRLLSAIGAEQLKEALRTSEQLSMEEAIDLILRMAEPSPTAG
ncbi:MAG: hypothetical protein IPM46_10775 [Flavobacteriales bacterium]|nr:hypothetical protein [Flavobacteriales bacterium]